MEKDFIFTQVKETTMTAEKTVTVVTERLEKVNIFGRRKLCGYKQSKTVEYHTDTYESRRIA